MLIVGHPDTYTAERRYVLGVVLGDFLGLDWDAGPDQLDETLITLAGDAEDRSVAIADVLFATPERDWLSPTSLPRQPLTRSVWPQGRIAPTLVDRDVPVLYQADQGNGVIDERAGRTEIAIDLFGSIFFQLTRYEELVEPARDEHERFPAAASLAHQEGFLDRPLVNEYVEILRATIERVWPRLELRRHAFRQRLSHDVDWPNHPPSSFRAVARAVGGDLVRRRDPGLARARLRAMRAQRRGRYTDDPYYSFELIMELSEQRGLRSAFYFMAGRTDPRFDGAYEIDEPWIGKLIRGIHERGHEVGLHPSYKTFRDPAAIRGERDALFRACERVGVSQPCWGGRQHFLRWENPITWRAWDEAGLTYDASLGYSLVPGFRCGVCYEYRVFDLIERRPLELRERPLIVMETAVIDTNGSRGVSLDTVETLRDRCRIFGGDFNLLWHNSKLASPRERGMYVKAL